MKEDIPANTPSPEKIKLCKHCGGEKVKMPSGAIACRPCANARAKKWAEEHPEARRIIHERSRARYPGVAKARSAAWYAANKDHALAQCREYRAKNAEQVQARRDRWKEKNPEKVAAWLAANRENLRQYAKLWRKENPEWLAEYRTKGHWKEWYDANRETIKKKAAAYVQSDRGREVTRAKVRRRQMMKRGLSSWLTDAELAAFVASGVRCFYCSRVPSECGKLTIDHVIPLSRGGEDALWNLVHSCRTDNCSKRDKFLWEWKPERFAVGYHPNPQKSPAPLRGTGLLRMEAGVGI